MAHELSRRGFIDQAKTVALATPFLSLLGCSDEHANGSVSLAGKTMGTTYRIELADVPQDTDPTTLGREIDGLLETVNRQMSTYRPDSELSRFNAADAGTWLPISNDTRSVIDEALRISRLTAGGFDPTIGPVIDLWGFGPDGEQGRVPSSDEIAVVQKAVGFTKVETRVEAPAVLKHDTDIRMDLSGVAKGFGVDKVAGHLDAQGMGNYLVEVGGELRGSGHGPGGRPWRVGIEKPSGAPGGLQRVVDLDRGAVATSGNYRIFFESNGRRYSHIVNPRSGRPVDHDLASASVVAETTMEADALSTSLLVLGPDAGMRLAVKHDIAAFFITGRSGAYRETASPAFERRFMS